MGAIINTAQETYSTWDKLGYNYSLRKAAIKVVLISVFRDTK